MKKYSILLFYLALMLILFLTGCMHMQNGTAENAPRREVPVETKIKQMDIELEKEITLVAIGDILIHDRVYNDAKTSKGYDFLPMIERVKPYLEDATVTIANQETMIGGEEIGLSSYPQFNSPYEVGDALKDVGVDVVTLANNHTLDRGSAAITSAIKHWNNLKMTYTGAYENEADSKRIRVLSTDEGIDLAFLSYTYGTNGIPVPDGQDYLVNLIDKDKIATDIREAEELADVTVISYHFGNEYQRMPSKEQKDLAQFASDLGADIVIGHHPHVLQPVEWLQGKEGNKTFVAYSLGNFLSGQDEFYRRIGGALRLTITKDDEQQITVKNPEFLPTFVDFKIVNGKMTQFEMFPMKEVTDSQLVDANQHYLQIKQHLSQWLPELSFIGE
ncbi:CapA family protein [Aquibacillus kalidii]|uniref:CapA family protein n=1 Tax=Aquibacillus kalidii TaxID=2762597 RepID=UPI001647B15E|nr:CapA family protein [Aquibacillus kalidii]